jgi:hypothetical protein
VKYVRHVERSEAKRNHQSRPTDGSQGENLGCEARDLDQRPRCRQIEAMVEEDEAYEQAKRHALAFLDQGFHLGGRHASIVRPCMSVKTFVDTNVLVYAHDVDDLLKHDLARDALRGLWIDGTDF